MSRPLVWGHLMEHWRHLSMICQEKDRYKIVQVAPFVPRFTDRLETKWQRWRWSEESADVRGPSLEAVG